jgi:hypothetical protein
MALLAGYVVRFLVPGLLPESAFIMALAVVLAAFILPFLWWRTAIGYAGGVILGVVTIGGWLSGAGALLESAVDSSIFIVPHFVIALLLIGGSVLAWREG